MTQFEDRPDSLSLSGKPIIIDPDSSVIRLLLLQQEWDWVVLSKSAGAGLVSGQGRVDHFMNILKHHARDRVLRRARAGEPQDTTDLVKVVGQEAFQLSPREKEELLGRRDDEMEGGPPQAGGRGANRGSNGRGQAPRGGTRRASGTPATSIRHAIHGGDDDDTVPTRAATLNGADPSTLKGWLESEPSVVLTHMQSPVLANPLARQPLPYEATALAWARTLLALGRLRREQLPPAVRNWLAADGAARRGDPAAAADTKNRAQMVDALVAGVPLARQVAAAAHDAVPPAAQPKANTVGDEPATRWRLPRPTSSKAPRADVLPEHDAGSPVGWSLSKRARRPAPPVVPPATSQTVAPDDAEVPPPEFDGFAWGEGFENGQWDDVTPLLPDEPVHALPYGESETVRETPRVTPAPPPVAAAPRAVVIYTEGETLAARLGAIADGVTRADGTLTTIGPLHRVDGPAVEDVDDPRHDRYFVDGQERQLALPESLAASRAFATATLQAWRALRFSGPDAKTAAAAVLRAWPVDAERAQWLATMRGASAPIDRVFAAAYDTGFGLPASTEEP
jgi:hypothetical protein